MRFNYSRKHLNIQLILGLVWLVWFGFKWLAETDLKWIDYGWLLISLTYLGVYIYLRQHGYLSIANGELGINSPLDKSLRLEDIREIRRFAGDYILKTGTKKLTINTQVLDRESLKQLDAVLAELPAEWT